MKIAMYSFSNEDEKKLGVVIGDHVTITFDRLGTLRQPIPQNIGPLETSRRSPRSFS